VVVCVSDLLESMISLEETTLRCIPRLASDPVIQKCDFNVSSIVLYGVEFHSNAGQKVVVLEQCGPLGSYIAEMLREMLAEENIEALVTFHF
jgi:hypothetical protein